MATFDRRNRSGGAVPNDGGSRINAATRSMVGTIYKATRIDTVVMEDGVQVKDVSKIKNIYSSYYAEKAAKTQEFEANHERFLDRVIAELNVSDTKYWSAEGMTEDAMIESLDNKVCRIALTTASIIPVSFVLGGKHYEIRTQQVTVSGPHPLVPDGYNGETCQYGNARNASPVISYWPKEITDRLISDLVSRARIDLVYVDENDQVVAKGTDKAYPGIMVGSKLYIAYKKSVGVQEIDNSKRMSWFKKDEPAAKPKQTGQPATQGGSTSGKPK